MTIPMNFLRTEFLFLCFKKFESPYTVAYYTFKLFTNLYIYIYIYIYINNKNVYFIIKHVYYIIFFLHI